MLGKAWVWFVGILATLGMAVLFFFGLRSRRTANNELAAKAVELAEKELERERFAAKTAVEEAVEKGRASANAELAAIDAEVEKEARTGDLGDAIDQLRGGI